MCGATLRGHDALRSRPMIRRVLVLAALGASFGTFFDWLHVVTGAIAYPGPPRFGVPPWVPFLYIGAALAIGLIIPAGDRLLGRRARFPHTPARLVMGFVGLCAVWFLSGALPFGTAEVSVLLAAASLGMWWALERTWQGLVAAGAAALGGCATEVLLSRAGLFRHTHPDALGVALWLPWIYVAAAVGLGNVGRWLAEPVRPPQPATEGHVQAF
jgi:hypothetical protein